MKSGWVEWADLTRADAELDAAIHRQMERDAFAGYDPAVPSDHFLITRRPASTATSTYEEGEETRAQMEQRERP